MCVTAHRNSCGDRTGLGITQHAASVFSSQRQVKGMDYDRRMEALLDRPLRTLTWLGQAGFRLEVAGLRVLVDPFYSGHEARLFDPPPQRLVDDADWILVTHEHLDHLDAGLLDRLLERAPESRVVVPAPLASAVPDWVEAGRAELVAPGDRVELGAGLHATVIPALHGVEMDDAYSDGAVDGGPPRFVGYVVGDGGRGVYHSGDTLVTDELIEALRDQPVDVALLPINGRHYFRERQGLIGNMGIRDAVGLAQELSVAALVPMHWDMMGPNTERPGAVADVAAESGAGFHVLVPARGRPLPLPG